MVDESRELLFTFTEYLNNKSQTKNKPYCLSDGKYTAKQSFSI